MTSSTSVSVIVPTFEEAGNVRPLYEAVRAVLGGALSPLEWELIYVDDNSSDGTSDAVRALSRNDRRVRIIERVGRRGLSSAVVEGAYASIFDNIVVMDGDLQHDPKYIPILLRPIETGEADICSASRFLEGADASGLSSAGRETQSRLGIRLVEWAFGLKMTDPLTGYFATRRDVVRAAQPDLSEIGFKILLDLIASSKPRPRLKEIPFTFGKRHSGDSKLDARVLYDFLLFLLEKKVWGISFVSPRFISFGLVGGSGVFIHLIAMALLISGLTPNFGESSDSNFTFAASQTGAALIAMAWNYTINNFLTFRDKRLSGLAFLRGLFMFFLLCSVGLVANVGAATALNNMFSISWTAPAIAGILVGTVWNYATTRRFVWKD